MTVQDDRTGHDATVDDITSRLEDLSLEVTDWVALEVACRQLIGSVLNDDGKGSTAVLIPTQRTDEVEGVLMRIDKRRHP